MNNAISRRELLRRAGSVGLFGSALTPLALNLAAIGNASAANTGGYKALVCVFLFGGNDAYNTVLATDAPSWTAYTAARGDANTNIALAAPGTPPNGAPGASLNARLGGVLPISPATPRAGRSFALHPVLGGVRDLFGAGRLAILANVGPLVQPMTKADWVGGRLARPSKLFSHNDQQSAWQAFAPEGSIKGWGGRLGDVMASGNRDPRFTAISLTGKSVWTEGASTHGFQLATSGTIAVGGSGATLFGSALVKQKLMALSRSTRNDQLIEREHAAMVNRSINTEAVLGPALPPLGSAPWSTPGNTNPDTDPLLQLTVPGTTTRQANPLAQQLQAVARAIAARSALGMNRQVFFVGIDGFDTHAVQPERHALGLARLNQALVYFDSVISQMGVADSVTTFTASDFGRAFTSNGEGTDHGWGGHHFIMGGGVHGGDLYGNFPVYGSSDGVNGFNSNDQLQANGSLLPSTGLPCYAATLGRWLGCTDAELLSAMPELNGFPAGQRQLGFVG
jgi:uncharacterized protein (DUF1501 family)